MFGKRCLRCSRRISRDFDFCPYCGNDFRTGKRIEKERDYGLLGKEDALSDFPRFSGFDIKVPAGFNGIFSSLLKEIDRQFKELDRQIGKDTERTTGKKLGEKMGVKGIKVPFNEAGGISISISSESGKPPKVMVKSFGNVPKFKEMEREIGQEMPEKKTEKISKISEERAREIAKLPREEAETKVRRLANKIIYEISLPGVNSIKDVVINKLENSIEIKAVAKDKVFFKLFPISLPIIKYLLKEGKLILELKPER